MALPDALRQAYRGANVLLLWDGVIARGYATHLWIIYRQAQALDGQVRRGADAGGDDVGGAACTGFLRCRPIYLFKLSQVDGLPDAVCAVKDKG